MSYTPKTSILGRTSYLGGIVHCWRWGRNVVGPATIFRNGREWEEGATTLFTVLGFGVARYDRRDPTWAPGWRPLVCRNSSGKPVAYARGWSVGFFRVQPH